MTIEIHDQDKSGRHYWHCGLGTGAGWGEEPDGEIVMLENGGLERCYKTEKNKSAIATMN